MDELESFKTAINLSEYAAGQGYVLDRKASSRNCATMRHPDGNKIIISRDMDGHWIYFSVRDDADHGTIIDFVQKRRRLSLGEVRLALRAWTGAGPGERPRPTAQTYAPEIERTTKDCARVQAEFARMQAVKQHAYLEAERHIPAAVLGEPRFAGKIYTDRRGNAIFPHHDQEGLCGFEIKNHRFTGFARGGEKGLWFSAAHKGDAALVIAESAIDAISYHVLHPSNCARYASIGGKMNPAQPVLIDLAVKRLPEGSQIIAATDADPDGRALAAQIGEIVKEAGQGSLEFIHHPPDIEGQDWNEVLKAQARASCAFAPRP